MTHAPPMHALTGPLRYGLTPVDIIFDIRAGRGVYTIEPMPYRKSMITGELALDEDGNLLIFIGMSEARRPILVVPGEDVARATSKTARIRAARNLHAARLHCESF